MYIWKAKGVPDMKRIMALCLFIELGFLITPSHTGACSCNWRGPFLTVAKDAPLVVRGRRSHRLGCPPRQVGQVLSAGNQLTRM